MLDAGADITPPLGIKGGVTLLHVAASKMLDLEVFRLLVHAGVDVTSRTARGETALDLLLNKKYKCIKQGKLRLTETIKALIGGVKNVSPADSIPLHLIRNMHILPEAFECWLDSRVDLNAIGPNARPMVDELLDLFLEPYVVRDYEEYMHALIARGAELGRISAEQAQRLQQEFNDEDVLQDETARVRSPNFILAACAYLMSPRQAQYPISEEVIERLGQLAAQLDQEGILPEGTGLGFVLSAIRSIANAELAPLPERWVDRIVELVGLVVNRAAAEYVSDPSKSSSKNLDKVETGFCSLSKVFKDKLEEGNQIMIEAIDKILDKVEIAKGKVFSGVI